MDNRWLSMREICTYLGVSHDTISRWIAKDMPAMKMGDRWKFKRDLVEKWLEEGGPKKYKKCTQKKSLKKEYSEPSDILSH